MTLKVGDRAPDFTLSATGGGRTTLSELLKKGTVVLYFYPKDDTVGCTMEACSFRDHHDVFAAAGAQVVGVSSDSVESHERFAQKHSLPMTLLSDPGGRVRALYEVNATWGLFPGRVTFVIDQGGVIRHVFDSQIRARAHVDEALATVKRLEGKSVDG
jgi:peroxiredoxin Q/BCP